MTIPPELAARIDEAVSHYPNPSRIPDEEALRGRLSEQDFAAEKERVRKERLRSAALPLLHLFQEHFGWVSEDAVRWFAQRLEFSPINVLELVPFSPMFRREPAGKRHIRVCRTLSCQLAGSYDLRDKLAEAAGLNLHPVAHTLGDAHGDPETTKDPHKVSDTMHVHNHGHTNPVTVSPDG